MWYLIFVFVFCACASAQNCGEPVFSNVYVNITMVTGTATQIALQKCSMSPPTISTDATLLKCENQKIAELPKASVANLPKLKELSLANNGIKNIQPGAFLNLTSLEDMDLRNNEITNIIAGIFDGFPLKYLRLDDNLIKNIDGHAFKNVPELSLLYLDYNDLSTWSHEWFANTPKLRTLSMNGNRLKHLPRGAFKNNNAISSISFGRNDITTVDPQTFEGLNNLHSLSLANNKIESFHPETFAVFNGTLIETSDGKKRKKITAIDRHMHKTFSGIHSIYVHGNRLTYLPEKMMRDLYKLTYINLHSNPFQCPCYSKIIKWIGREDIGVDVFDVGCIRKSNPVCVVSSHHPNVCVEEVDITVQDLFFKHFRPADDSDFFDRDVRCFGRD